MTFNHQDLWYGKLVPCPHTRGKPTFSRGNNWIWKGISITDRLREEWDLAIYDCIKIVRNLTKLLANVTLMSILKYDKYIDIFLLKKCEKRLHCKNINVFEKNLSYNS